ncbi:Type-1 restriction enzyme MjaXIP specificity protein [Candidatus Methanoperedenaceae archaeon GB50]|nr:Type-1 restriction enzyme MjaXIP specificity protein [Candidatus Methanoperedenaceae archaeon GB50]
MGKMKGEKIPPGYKKTEIGIIPEDWELVKIGDVFNFKNGLNKAKEFFGKGTSIVNYMDVYQHPGITKKEIKGKVTVTKDELKAYEVRKGDTFFTRTSETVEEIGIASTIVDEVNDTVFSGFILRARPKSDRLNLNFRKYCFASQIVRKQIISTSSYTTRALTNGRLLSNVYVPAPKTQEEQRAIARVLSDFDKLIESLDRLIEKKKLIKKGTMQLLLTGKKRLPGFKGEWVRKKTEIGIIPEDWEVRRLGEVCRINPESLSENTPKEFEFNYIPLESIDKGRLKGFNKLKFENAPSRARRVVRKGDVLLSTVRPYLLSHFYYNGYPKNTVCSTGFSVLRCKSDLLSKYLYFHLFFKTINRQIDKILAGSNYPAINSNDVKSFQISLPPLPEQRAIARVLSDMDAEIEALEKKKEKCEMLKKGAMQSLLTGKVRLKDHIDEVLA